MKIKKFARHGTKKKLIKAREIIGRYWKSGLTMRGIKRLQIYKVTEIWEKVCFWGCVKAGNKKLYRIYTDWRELQYDKKWTNNWVDGVWKHCIHFFKSQNNCWQVRTDIALILLWYRKWQKWYSFWKMKISDDIRMIW